ncbi:MAG: TRAP transporter large permease [Rhodospirillaceae bacterium]|jgi:C4-dicarboxylate transporter, DctM subunit|nr:TRAP transporter large permease [Rhodospirillaceae bacterium]MBT3886622.1 TRAP transporter large permease [Rhodospirillaceae bacterium]MBT4118395.1 TRAP transporter large permease [Rhodospirillaceae bacterium]MBT4671851.1 TRAP transporter large permease [Rhodospirillaceae bacterium]MBT4719261.1 TRAP transporter large permease [Rhodospirillaceae bacterium]
MNDPVTIALIASLIVVVLMLMRVPIAIALGGVAVLGFGFMVDFEAAIGLLIDSPIRTITNFNFSVIPMFVLMGVLVSAGGMSRELFRAANAWVGHFPGGMAMATILACGGFAAINGSSIATAATMTNVALPEMRRVGYNPGLSAGIIASGGTLGIMIPPSVMFILYAIITENDVATLFLAGIIPGLISIVLYCITVQVLYRFKKDWMPRSQAANRKERWDSLKDVWATVLLFVLVMGGIYGGFVTITEAAGLGVLGALGISFARKRLTWKVTVDALVESLRNSAAIFFILVAAFLFQFFLAVTQAPQLLAGFLGSLDIGPTGVIILIMIFYILAGMFVDGLAVILLTIPIFYPVVLDLGFDPIWFGVLVVMTVEIGLISPPIGMICFIMNNMVRDIGLVNIYKGVLPFMAADFVRLSLLVSFPALALWIPNTIGWAAK